ncbi:septum formation family protein [Saccharothrix sp. HUAS TT1]|uniref:septum formation family protein n=1 Tax=unclassified Saccharothrix TaxID=2593673 RepID=UPI00345C4685
MGDPVKAGLAEAATPRLYRRNAFRVTGLPTDADRPTARRLRNKVTSMLEVGADVDLGHDLDVDAAEVARAFDLVLGDPRRRLVDELFWLWDTGSATCGCAQSVHRDHDEAVRAHSRALDLEARDELTDDELDELEQLWPEAGRLWGRALRRAAFWDHVRHRVAALDDRQLDESVVDLLRDEMPVVLLAPLVQLAAAADADRGWLADRVREWPAPAGLADDLLERAAEPLYEEVRAHLKDASDELAADDPAAAAAIVSDVVLDLLDQLDDLAPPDRHRRTASIRDDTAIALNNCATKLVETVGSKGAGNARKWLGTAAELARDPQAVTLIERNQAAITELADAMAMIRKQVRELVALGRRDIARRMLKQVRARAAGMAGAEEIDEMLRDLGVHVPAPRQPRWSEPARGRTGWDGVKRLFIGVWRAVALLLFAALVLAGVRWVFGDDGTVDLFSHASSGNAPVGTCVATEDGWEGDKRQVPSVPCEEQHWGEVLAYVPVGDNPSTHPGDEVVRQRAGYECAWSQARQDLPFDTYTTRYAYPGEDSWNDGGKSSENYATCVVHRVDNAPLAAHNLVDADRERADDLTLTRDLHSIDIGSNPPVGSCVADKGNLDTNAHEVAFARCDRPHWGEVIGYPVLYRPEEQWPGDAAVYAAADAACLRAAVDLGLDAAYHYHTTWPGSSWWTDTPDKPKYAACTASRADGTPVQGSLK